MIDLNSALDGHDLIVLRIIGEWLELDLTGEKRRSCIKAIAPQLAQLNMPLELSYLPIEEADALREIVNEGGRIPVAVFERNFGNIRQMGPGKMEREEPWLDPISPAEALWYRGFLFRGFLESEDEQLVEYYYMPREYLEQFPNVSRSSEDSHTGLFQTVDDSTIESSEIIGGRVDSVDDVTGLLAHSQIYAIREENLFALQRWMLNQDLDRLSMLFHLCWDLKLFRATDEGARPTRAAISWLEQSREIQLRELANGWLGSSWNELHHTPGLICEGDGWSNDPALARTALLKALPRHTKWARLIDLIGHIKQSDPDFQRPDGRYDTWYIRDSSSGDFLTGFENWDLVDGKHLEFLIEGPLSWFGMVDLYYDEVNQELLFRLNERAINWLQKEAIEGKEVTIPIVVHNDATVTVSQNSSRYDRFQVARIGLFQPPQVDQPFEYWITPDALNLAREQGIEVPRIIEFLESASERDLPPGTKRSIERWSDRGVEGRLQEAIILLVREPEILEKLRANPKTRPYIAEALGDLSTVVKLKDWHKLRHAAAQLGLLLEASIEDD
jgi:hypothetical protein